jgi:dTDP-4-dehydrorhamnose 3,5-epimerase
MKITETELKGCYIIVPEVYSDERGMFLEQFKKHELEKALGFAIDFVQENKSISKKGVLRGLHFQTGEAAQAKLVTVQKGKVLDIIVDLRPNSETYGKHLKIKLSDQNFKSIFIPKGMAHGFLALSHEVVFTYKCDNYYNPDKEAGIIYNDIDLNINWEYPFSEMIISEKDNYLPLFKTLKNE